MTINSGCVQIPTYEQLKDLAISEDISAGMLMQLKNMFAAEIETERRRDFIQTLADLIDCLERRDALSEHNVECLQKLAEHSNSVPLLKALLHYNAPTMPGCGAGNQYQQLQSNEHRRMLANQAAAASTPCSSNNNNMAASVKSSKQCTALSKQQRATIYKLLAKELGKDWRAFGRELNLNETTMDEIELQYPRDLSQRVYRVLQLFEEDDDNEPAQQAKRITDALNDCLRKDLRRKVESLLQ